MRREPDERYHAAIRSRAEPDHPIESLLWRCARGLDSSDHMTRAIEVYGDQFERERLQPWILAGAEDNLIVDRVGLHPEMLTAYKHLCFNVSLFRDLLDKQRWVNGYEQRPGSTREGALYLRKALLHGVEAVAHVMGAPCRIEPNDVLEHAMRDTYFRGLALRDARLTGAEAVAAHGMLKTATALAQEQAKVRPPGVNDILIRIKHRDLTQSLDNMTEEIFH